ncbi:MAG: Wzy polymerase domain-containing protein, partial [Burkholderiaceae bacterium]
MRSSRELACAMASAWLAAGLLSALFGLLQYFGAAAEFAPWINRSDVGEAFANLRQRNQFATLTNMALAAVLWFVAQSGRRRAWWALAAVCLAVGNAASGSRTGFVQLFMLVGLAMIWGARRKPEVLLVLLAAVLAYVLATFALPLLGGLDLSTNGMVARLRTGAPVCASRLTLWGNVLHLIEQKPLTGWGWGELDYGHFITLYPGARFCDILDNAHNLPLHLAVELGLPFATIACTLALGWVWISKPWRETNPTRRLAWAVLALILLHSMLEYPLWYGPFQVAALLCLWTLWTTRSGLHSVHSTTAGAPQEDPGPTLVSLWPIGETATAQATGRSDVALGGAERAISPSMRIGLISVSTALLLFIAYAGWDYWRISQIYLAPDQRSPAYRRHTLSKISDSRLFRNQVRFAELTTTEVTRDNALHIHRLAEEMLHFSPETRVVEKLIESDLLLKRDDEALFYQARFRAAFPTEYAAWVKDRAGPE